MGSKKNQDFLDGWTLNWNPLSVTMHKILLRGTYQKKTRRTRAVYDVVWKRQKKESLSKFHSVGRYYLILKSFVVAILSLSRPKIKKQINLYGHLQHEIHEPSANQQSFELRTLTSSQPTPACSRGFLLHPCSSLSFPGVNWYGAGDSSGDKGLLVVPHMQRPCGLLLEPKHSQTQGD